MSAPAALGARTPGLGRLLILAALAELIVDKLPFVPSRLEAPPLLGRLIAGGYAGASGAFAAAAGAVLGCRSRRYIVARLGAPDALVALAEDALAIGIVVALDRQNG